MLTALSDHTSTTAEEAYMLNTLIQHPIHLSKPGIKKICAKSTLCITWTLALARIRCSLENSETRWELLAEVTTILGTGMPMCCCFMLRRRRVPQAFPLQPLWKV